MQKSNEAALKYCSKKPLWINRSPYGEKQNANYSLLIQYIDNPYFALLHTGYVADTKQEKITGNNLRLQKNAVLSWLIFLIDIFKTLINIRGFDT